MFIIELCLLQIEVHSNSRSDNRPLRVGIYRYIIVFTPGVRRIFLSLRWRKCRGSYNPALQVTYEWLHFFRNKSLVDCCSDQADTPSTFFSYSWEINPRIHCVFGYLSKTACIWIEASAWKCGTYEELASRSSELWRHSGKNPVFYSVKIVS